jgi:peptidoglycan/LPS O-acetylase OafA/YrhL
MFLQYIQGFRAIAIIIIVAYHTLGWFKWSQNKETLNILSDVLANGTVLFVFISGYLFQHLSRNFNYRKYLNKKFMNVILPYLIISVPAIVYSVFHKNPIDIYSQLAGTSKIYQVFWFYIKGGAHLNFVLWFIPMIAVYYLLAPSFVLLIKYPKLYFLILIALPLSLLVHRPDVPNLNLFHSSIYFLSAYMIGMFASQHREKIEIILERNLSYVVTFTISFFILQHALSDHHGNYHSKYIFAFSEGNVDWQFLQKVFLCFSLLGVLKRYEKFVTSTIKYIADISFTIFFVHVYFLFLFKVLARWVKIEGNFFNWFGLFIVVMLSCIIFTWIGQIALGKYSKVLIGAPSRHDSGWRPNSKLLILKQSIKTH